MYINSLLKEEERYTLSWFSIIRIYCNNNHLYCNIYSSKNLYWNYKCWDPSPQNSDSLCLWCAFLMSNYSKTLILQVRRSKPLGEGTPSRSPERASPSEPGAFFPGSSTLPSAHWEWILHCKGHKENEAEAICSLQTLNTYPLILHGKGLQIPALYAGDQMCTASLWGLSLGPLPWGPEYEVEAVVGFLWVEGTNSVWASFPKSSLHRAGCVWAAGNLCTRFASFGICEWSSSCVCVWRELVGIEHWHHSLVIHVPAPPGHSPSAPLTLKPECVQIHGEGRQLLLLISKTIQVEAGAVDGPGPSSWGPAHPDTFPGPGSPSLVYFLPGRLPSWHCGPTPDRQAAAYVRALSGSHLCEVKCIIMCQS